MCAVLPPLQHTAAACRAARDGGSKVGKGRGGDAPRWVPQSEIEEAALFEELPAFLRGAVASHLLRDILPSLDLWQVWGLSTYCHLAVPRIM